MSPGISPVSGLVLDIQTESFGPGRIDVISQKGIDAFIARAGDLQHRLACVPVGERLRVFGNLGAMWADDLRAGRLDQLIASLSVSTGYGTKMIELELAFIPNLLNSANLERNLTRTLISAPQSLESFVEVENGEYLRYMPAGSSFIISSGNSMIPSLVPTVSSLITGNVTMLRPSLAVYPAVAELFKKLEQVDGNSATKAVREALAISYYPHSSPVLKHILEETRIGTINIWGGGTALDKVRKAVSVNPNHPRLHVNGPMTGLAVIDEESADQPCAEGLAREMVLYDQQLCSSPTAALFIGTYDRAVRFSLLVGRCLDGYRSQMSLKRNDEEMFTLNVARRFLQANGSTVISSKDQGNPWTLVISRERSCLDGMAAVYPSMGISGRKRFIEIIVIDDPVKITGIISSLMTVNRAFTGIDKVQTAGVALSGHNLEKASQVLLEAGVFRILPLGNTYMRSAVEPYDGIGTASMFTYIVYRRTVNI